MRLQTGTSWLPQKMHAEFVPTLVKQQYHYTHKSPQPLGDFTGEDKDQTHLVSYFLGRRN